MTTKAAAMQAKARLLYVLSPAKTLDMAAPSSKLSHSLPTMLEDARELVTELRKLTPAKLKALLGVSDAIAKLNHDRFRAFEFLDASSSKSSVSADGTHKQAALAFNGPAYQGLAAHELSNAELEFAQRHLRILCGLYGTLRPLDLIQAYRLEMGQKFANARGKDLYAFWGDRIAKALSEELAKDDDGATEKVLVNVASQEYFKSVAADGLDDDIKVIDCVFKDDGAIKSVYAKRARGLMCRYLIANRVDSIAGIQAFDLEGYAFSPKESSDSTFVFNRSAAKQKEVLKQIQAKAKAAKDLKTKAEDTAESVKVEAASPKKKSSAGARTAKGKKEATPVKDEVKSENDEGLRRSKRRRT